MRWLVYPFASEYEPAGQIQVNSSTFSTPDPINADGVPIDSGRVDIRGCQSASFIDSTFAGTTLNLDSCKSVVRNSTFNRGVSVGHSESSKFESVKITNPGGTALAVYSADVSVAGSSFSNAEIAIDSDYASHVAFRGTIGTISGERWVKACNWSPDSDCGVDASYVDWGPGGPMPDGQPSRVCGQVLVDPWIGMAEDANVFRSPNCDGSIYSPSQQLSDASSHANQRLADVYATCDPNDPLTADACKIYEMYHSCIGAAIELARAGSTFPILDLTDPADSPEFASGLASSLSDGLAASDDPFVAADGQLFSKLTGLLQVIDIASELVNAYYERAP